MLRDVWDRFRSVWDVRDEISGINSKCPVKSQLSGIMSKCPEKASDGQFLLDAEDTEGGSVSISQMVSFY